MLGVAFTLLSLLFAISLCLVGSAAIGATIAETSPHGRARPHAALGARRIAREHPGAFAQRTRSDRITHVG